MRRPVSRYITVGAVTVGITAAATGVAVAGWVAGNNNPKSAVTAASMPDGPVPTAEPVGADSNTVVLRWSAATIGSLQVTDYRVRRYPAAGGPAETVGTGCAGTITALTCTETGVANGVWRYSVTAVHGSWTGPEGDRSDRVTVDSDAPSIAVGYPAEGGRYGVAAAAAATAATGHPGALSGTVTHSDATTVDATVRVKRDGTGTYWNGSSFSGTAPVEVNATVHLGTSQSDTVTDTWTLPFSMTDVGVNGAYTVTITARDSLGAVAETIRHVTLYPQAPSAPIIDAFPVSPTNETAATVMFAHPLNGNAESWDDVTFECALDGAELAACGSPFGAGPAAGAGGTDVLADGEHTFSVRAKDAGDNRGPATTRSWTVDTTAPTGETIAAVNGDGVAGRIDPGDKLTFTFSEPIAPESVTAGWTGKSAASVTVRVTPGVQGDVIEVYAGASPLAALGSVSLGVAGHVKAVPVAYAASMAVSGDQVTVTIWAAETPGDVATAAGAGAMTWTPGGVQDLAGNGLHTPATAVLESGPADLDF